MADKESREPTREEIVAKWRQRREQESREPSREETVAKWRERREQGKEENGPVIEIGEVKSQGGGIFKDKKKLLGITVTTVVVAIVVLVEVIGAIGGNGPAEPTTFDVYDNPQSSVSFSYPSEWNEYDWTGYEEITGVELDQETKEQIEQGIFSIAFFQDPTESGVFLGMTIDHIKAEEPATELDEITCAFLAFMLAGSLENHDIDDAKKITLEGMSTKGDYEAWEVSFRGTNEEGVKLKCNTVIGQYESKTHIVMFMCSNSAYDTLEPAYEKFKETFVMR